MGRYDKIRVFKDGSWRQPSRIYVRKNGSWIDLGTNDSNITTPLNVRKNGAFIRATLNKNVYNVNGDSYVKNQFKLDPTNYNTRGDWCLYQGTLSSDTSKYGSLYLRAWIYKEQNVDANIFYSYNSNVTSYLKITWKADGRIEVRTKYSGSEYSVVTSNAVYAGNWVYLNIEWPWDTSTTNIYFNGVHTQSTANAQFLSVNMDNLVGDSVIRFKDTFSINLYNYRPTDAPIAQSWHYTDLAKLTTPAQFIQETTQVTEWI